MPARNVSGVTLRDFFSAALRQMGAPVTENNLSKLGAVAQLEGHGGDYNPFNYIVGPGSNFNSVGVKNYPDINTGVSQLVKLLSQKNTGAMRANLQADAPYSGWVAATSNFYHSWGGPTLIISQPNALAKLNQQIDGPRVSGGFTGGGAAPAGGGGVSVPDSGAPDWAGIKRWIDTEEQKFGDYLGYLQPGEQQQLIDTLRSNHQNGLAAWGAYLPTAAPEVQNYVYNFLAKLPKQQQDDALFTDLKPVSPRVGQRPTMPTADAGMSAELQQLLGRFGVSYPNAPAPTPALLAFLRGVGSSLSTAEDLKQRAVDQVNQRATLSNSDISRTAERSKQSITSDLLRRGVLSSGESNTRYAHQAEDVAAARSDVEQNRVSGATQADFAYQQAADNARQQALERTLGVEQQQQGDFASAQANYDAQISQMHAADLAYQREQAAQEDQIKRQEQLMRQYAASGLVL